MFEEKRILLKKSKKIVRRVVIVLSLMVISLGCGFAGSYLENILLNNTGIANGKTVLYQSVVNTSTSKNGTLSIANVVSSTKDSVVEITTEIVSKNGRLGQLISTGAGSGVIISKDGYIVTNNHVIDGAGKITVRLSDGNSYQATLIGTDTKTDLAIIKINKNNLQPVVFGTSKLLEVGEAVVAIGNPLGELGGTVTEGIISALDRQITIDNQSMSLLQTSAAINPGNSGGALFNMSGELVGIVNAKSSGSDIEGLGFAIPIDTAKAIIEDLIANGYVKGRIDTGLTVVYIGDAITAMQYRVSKLGLYITESQNDDFQVGDIITSIEGTLITDLTSYNNALNKYKVGDTIKITITRNGKSITNSLKLGELKT